MVFRTRIYWLNNEFSWVLRYLSSGFWEGTRKPGQKSMKLCHMRKASSIGLFPDIWRAGSVFSQDPTVGWGFAGIADLVPSCISLNPGDKVCHGTRIRK
jgi:hypothetical protein